MQQVKIGVLCPSEIAFRRFMPAVKKIDQIEYIGIASASADEWFGTPSDQLVATEKNKAENFKNTYGGKVFADYHTLLNSDEIDAVYIPLPPALHYPWAKLALECGKHILLEKPFTSSLADTEQLIDLASSNDLAVHENYMFVYHNQLDYIKKQLSAGVIGELRLIRIDFGFPFRGSNDFRYNKRLGGGALLDCGGYTLKLAEQFLGHTAKVTVSQLNYRNDFDVDIYGSATVTNDSGLTAQLSFGMDNSYKCSIELWGSKGTIYTNRILTAPSGYEPIVTIKNDNGENNITLPADDTFMKSIKHFIRCINDKHERVLHYDDIIRQSALVDSIK